MTRSNSAYRLIRCLSKAEKRHFKLFSTRHIIGEENKYILLFDALDKMKSFEEEALRLTLGENHVETKFLKADLNYLYHQILRSLVHFHHGKTANLTLKVLLCDIEILFDKGEFDLCGKEIEKALEIARNYELLDLRLHTLNWERRYSSFVFPKHRPEKEILEEMELVAERNNRLIALTQLQARATQIMREYGKTRRKSLLDSLEQIIKKQLPKIPDKDLGIMGRIKRHQIMAIFHFLKNDRKTELLHNRQLISLIEENKHILEEYPLDYVNSYSRILSITKEIEPQNFDAELKKFRAFQASPSLAGSLRINAQVFNYSYMIELSKLIAEKKFKDAFEKCSAVDAGLAEFDRVLNPSSKLTFSYILAYIHFAAGNFKKCRRILNTILNDFKEEIRPDIYNFARLLNIITSFELKEYRLIESLTGSAEYYFKKNEGDHALENIILRFFSLPTNYQQNKRKNLEALVTEIRNAAGENQIDASVFKYFDFLYWINQKAEGKLLNGDLNYGDR